MKNLLVIISCFFILSFYLNVNAYGAETEELEPWEVVIQNAETLLDDGNLDDAYREALSAINVYLNQTHFEAESFISMIELVLPVARQAGGKEAGLVVIVSAISVAERLPDEHASALIDLWLLMAAHVTLQNERDEAIKNALDISKNIYSPTDEEIIDVYMKVFTEVLYVYRQPQQAEEILIDMSEYIASNFAEDNPMQYKVDIARIESLVFQELNSRSRRKNWSELEGMTLSLFEKLEGYGKEADSIRYDIYIELAIIYSNDGRENKIDEIISKITDLEMSGVRHYKPILTPPPIYPRRAQERTLGGVVYVKFCVDENGDTYDVEAINTRITYYTSIKQRQYKFFERPSIKAVRKFKYIPTFVDGIAVSECGIGNEIVYEMEL